MTIHSTMLSEAAQETEMLNASLPSPLDSAAYYVIFSSGDRKEIAAKFVTHSKKAPKRRNVAVDAKTEAALAARAIHSPMPAAPTPLPFAFPFFWQF